MLRSIPNVLSPKAVLQPLTTLASVAMGGMSAVAAAQVASVENIALTGIVVTGLALRSVSKSAERFEEARTHTQRMVDDDPVRDYDPRDLVLLGAVYMLVVSDHY